MKVILQGILLMSVACWAKVQWTPMFTGVADTSWYFTDGTNNTNRRTLNNPPRGWSFDGADIKYSITGTTQSEYNLLYTKKADYENFTVKYAYRMTKGCSGFFFRAKDIANGSRSQGGQIETKSNTQGYNRNAKVGSLYCQSCPGGGGWVKDTEPSFTPNTLGASSGKLNNYWDHYLTVSSQKTYVNVNGYQAVGESDAAVRSSTGATTFYFLGGNQHMKNPGQFGIQVHGGQTTMDFIYTGMAILQACLQGPHADTDRPGNLQELKDAGLIDTRAENTYGNRWAQQPVVYEHNDELCIAPPDTSDTTNIAALPAAESYINSIKNVGSNVLLTVSVPGAHTLEILNTQGQVVTSLKGQNNYEYKVEGLNQAGVYFAQVTTSHGVQQPIKFAVY